MFPQIRLAVIFAKFAKDHGHKILHANNPDLLTRDLGDAMKKQKQVLSDPNKGALFTAYDILPLIAEVKILTFVTANKLGVPYLGRSDIEVLEGILAASRARNDGKYAKDIEGTLEWTRKLFSHPEIQDVLSMEMTAITVPKSPRDVMKFFGQIVGRSQDELTRLTEFLRKAKAGDLFVEETGTAQKPAVKKPAAKKRGGKGPAT